MKSRLLAQDRAERTFAVVLDDGEEVFAAMTRFAAEQDIGGASLTAIGAFRRLTVGFFDFQTKDYRKIPIEEQCEVLSALGDIAMDEQGKPSLHLHVVVGLSDGTTRGGHFLEGVVHPTLEVIVRESPVHLRRRKRSDLGVALIDIEAK